MVVSGQRITIAQPSASMRTIISPKTMLICAKLSKTRGIHSSIQIEAAGFNYTNIELAAQCHACGLQVSHWPLGIEPFALHAQLSPTCSFVLSLRPASINTGLTASTTAHIDDDQSRPQTKLDPLIEANALKMARQRSFSHWPHRRNHLAGSLIEAGFFCCNVGDRVICLYCHLICQGWGDGSDDACAVHKTLSPGCRYVGSMLMGPGLTPLLSSSIVIINERTATSNATTPSTVDSARCNTIVTTNACHPLQAEIPRRHASFTSWSSENVPPVDDLVRAGFFYTGTQTIVTCFFCNGSLQNWGPNDNPMVEHARWFPHCAYIKQLCGSRLYQQIRDSQRAHKGLTSFSCTFSVEYSRLLEKGQANSTGEIVQSNGNSNRMAIPDESTLSRLVAARLDLPVSQRLLNQNFKLSVIKRCWEDQLRLKGLFDAREK